MLPIRLDHDIVGGGDIMLYVREHVTAKLLTIEKLHIEGFYVELNLRKQKWFRGCSYNKKDLQASTQMH